MIVDLISCVVMSAMTAAIAVAEPAEPTEPAESYFARVQQTLDLCRADIPAMKEPAEKAASMLSSGGSLWAGEIPAVISELCGRAGGFMMIKPAAPGKVKEGDVVIYAAQSTDADMPKWAGLRCYVVEFSGKATGPCPHGFRFNNHADQTGVSMTLADAVWAWTFSGELVAALTRLDKMPVMYESIGAYDGNARIRRFENGAIAWHAEHDVQPVPHGNIGRRYLEIISGLLDRVKQNERDDLATVAQWAAAAHRADRQLFMYSMGHLFPDEVQNTDIGKLFRSAVWNAGFRRHDVPDHQYGRGDVAVHIGYQHPPRRLLERARPAGARVGYVSVRRDRNYIDDTGAVWIDPMWPWSDAVVDIEGYDVPVLPASGIVNATIAWEIYRLTTTRLNPANP